MNQSITVDLTVPIQMVEAAGLFSSLCNILAPTQALDAAGQVDLTDTTPVVGLQNIPCMKAPLVDGSVSPNFTERQEDVIREYQLTHVLLDGYYPTIEKRYIAQVDGTLFEIRNAESDSQQTMTRLALREYYL